jgi:HPt (histidine-containing phosphotransfer) domain-containing protein
MDKPKHYIETKRLEEIAGGDNDFMKEVIGIFLNQIPEFTGNMRSLLKDQNWNVLAREAHTAKSSALTFGMEETGVLLKKIQLQAEAGDYNSLPSLVDEAIGQLEAAIPELHELKNSL